MRPILRRLKMSSAFLVFAGLWAFVSAGTAETVQDLTPLLLTVQDAPIPFNGSDGRMHMVYELWITNFSSGDVTVEKVEVLGDGAVLQTLDAAAVAGRLQAAGSRDSSGTIQRPDPPRQGRPLLETLSGSAGTASPRFHQAD